MCVPKRFCLNGDCIGQGLVWTRQPTGIFCAHPWRGVWIRKPNARCAEPSGFLYSQTAFFVLMPHDVRSSIECHCAGWCGWCEASPVLFREKQEKFPEKTGNRFAKSQKWCIVYVLPKGRACCPSLVFGSSTQPLYRRLHNEQERNHLQFPDPLRLQWIPPCLQPKAD